MNSRIVVAAFGAVAVLLACALGAALLQLRSIDKRMQRLQAEGPRGVSTIETATVGVGNRVNDLNAHIAGLNSAIGTILASSRIRLPDTQDRGQTGAPLPFGGFDPRAYRTVADCHSGGRTMVLVPVGQSNAANYAGAVSRSKFGEAIVNYFAGTCYVAEDPLLGADGDSGSVWVALANDVVSAGLYDRVIIAPMALGGTSIERWRQNGDLNDRLVRTLDSLKSNQLDATHVFWVQGEADRQGRYSETSGLYAQALAEVIATIRSQTRGDIFISKASSCPNPAEAIGPAPMVRAAQVKAVDVSNRVFAGPDLDGIREFKERYDRCHLTADGVASFGVQAVAAIRSAAPAQVKLN